MRHKFLVHNKGDFVGIAVEDIDAGELVHGVYLDDDSSVDLIARNAVPLGHKIALVNAEPGQHVIEYGTSIGVAPEGFAKGDYVHTHNLRSARW